MSLLHLLQDLNTPKVSRHKSAFLFEGYNFIVLPYSLLAAGELLMSKAPEAALTSPHKNQIISCNMIKSCLWQGAFSNQRDSEYRMLNFQPRNDKT